MRKRATSAANVCTISITEFPEAEAASKVIIAYATRSCRRPTILLHINIGVQRNEQAQWAAPLMQTQSKSSVRCCQRGGSTRFYLPLSHRAAG
jgi:hypothetical protein